jgi:hypothetical protein
LDLHENELAKYKNFVGMGVVLLGEDSKQAKAAENVVAVYVRKKVPKDQLPPDELIPQYLEIKGRGKVLHVPVKVIEQGEVTLESPGRESPDVLGKEPL